jgi:cytochrome b6-f complex iron-sulfur subunit
MSEATSPTPAPQPATPIVPNPEVTRRSFLLFGWGAFLAFLASAGGATLRFFLPNVLYEPSQKFRAGIVRDYPLGVTIDKPNRVWIVRNDRGLYAMWARCTHLGCTPNWFPAESRFRCPCHGSNFSAAGDVIAGPAPKPLWRVQVTQTPEGELVVDKAVMENRPGPRDKEPFFITV